MPSCSMLYLLLLWHSLTVSIEIKQLISKILLGCLLFFISNLYIKIEALRKAQTMIPADSEETKDPKTGTISNGIAIGGDF